MVTGVETASLVLAAFPVAIECIKYYVDAASKMKEMRNHWAVLRQLAREVKAERTIFKNSWNRLLQLAGGTPNLSLSPLDPDSVSSIVDICEDLIDILEELKHRFEKYERTKVCPLPVNAYRVSDTARYLDWILKDVTRHLQSYR